MPGTHTLIHTQTTYANRNVKVYKHAWYAHTYTHTDNVCVQDTHIHTHIHTQTTYAYRRHIYTHRQRMYNRLGVVDKCRPSEARIETD
jgi:hypothetical protein